MKFTYKSIFFILICASLLFSTVLISDFFSQSLDSPDGDGFGRFGVAVSSAGDVNNDGYDDILIGAPGEIPNSAVYIYSVYDQKFIDTLYSPINGREFGVSVAGLGDIDNDGFSDVVVGTKYPLGYFSGIAYVYSGATGDTLYSLTSPNPQNSGYFGSVVANAGDVNNDGVNDILIGAPEEFPFGINRAGSAYIFDGVSGDTIHTLLSPDTVSAGYFGEAIAGIGDINNDEYDDVLVGAPGAAEKKAYIFSGATGDTLFAFSSPNPQSSSAFGRIVSGAGDVNNDGTNDVIIGSAESVTNLGSAGRAYVFSGANGNLIWTLISPDPQSFGYFGGWGTSISAVGDINGDEHDDILIGAMHETIDFSREGLLHVFSGATGDTLCTLQSLLPEMDGRFAVALSGAADFNNDGIRDIIAGAPQENGGYQGTGRVHLFSTAGFDTLVSSLTVAQSRNPKQFILLQNYPNPFNPSTNIPYELFRASDVKVSIYDLAGKLISSETFFNKPAGQYTFNFDGSNYSSGVYIYSFESGLLQQTRKMVLLK